MEIKTIPITVYAESTPNPATMKFVCNKLLIENGATIEYTSPEAAKESELASQIFNFPFVTGIFIAGNFISVTKNNIVEWMDVTLDLREYIKEYLTSGKTVIKSQGSGVRSPETGHPASGGMSQPLRQPTSNAELVSELRTPNSELTQIEQRIIELLEEYIRPAVEQDGGAIHFKSFESGVLKVVLRGSCSGCPSSTVTLKSGIQGLFARMLPEVTEVVAEEA